jgi:hypothetical protein
MKPSEIIAFRSPSYFAGDLRRLKVVDLVTLYQRAATASELNNAPKELQRSAEEKVQFFELLRNCVVMCNKGRAEADKMSGGDYGTCKE